MRTLLHPRRQLVRTPMGRRCDEDGNAWPVVPAGQWSYCVVRRSRVTRWPGRSPDFVWRSLPCKPWGGGQRHWWSRSLTFQFLRFGGGVTATDVEQTVDIPARSRGLQGFRPGQVAQFPHRVGCLTTQMKEFDGFVRTFPRPKKSAEVTRQSSRVCPPVSAHPS